MALGRHQGGLGLHRIARAFGGADGRVAGVLLPDAGACADNLVLASTARVLRRLDDSELAALDEHEIRSERAALHARNVPRLHTVRAPDGDAPPLERPHHGLVAPLPRALRHALRAGVLGVLIF